LNEYYVTRVTEFFLVNISNLFSLTYTIQALCVNCKLKAIYVYIAKEMFLYAYKNWDRFCGYVPQT